MSDVSDQRRYYERMMDEIATEHRQQIDQLETENAKLREQIHWLKKGDILHVLTDQEYFDQCERERLMQVSIDALDKENAKLRELLQRTWDAFHDATAREFVMVKNELRELGVVVE